MQAANAIHPHGQRAVGTAAWVALPLGLVLGAAAQLQQSALWQSQAYGLMLLIAAVLMGFFAIKSEIFRGLGNWLAWPVLIGLAALFGFGSTGWRAQQHAAQALPTAWEGIGLLVQGRIVGLPTVLPAGTRFELELERVQAPDAADRPALPLPMRVRLGWYATGAGTSADASRVPLLKAGQRWDMAVRLKAPHGNLNPGGFDYELWLWEQGIAATGNVRLSGHLPPPRLVESTWRDPVSQARHWVRSRLVQAVPDARTAGVLAALVVGDQAAIERADWDVFRATGVAHLMSISGLHITAFAWLAMRLVGWLWRRSPALCSRVPLPHAAWLSGVGWAAAYALFSGWGVPAQRTVLMLGVVLALRWRGKHWPWPVVWLWAMAVVCAWDPWALLQAGFWLSFVAVGVLMMQPPAPAPWGGGWMPRIRQAARALLREQARITLALTPVSLILFGQASVVGFAANLVAIPWVTLVVTPLALMGVLWPPLWALAAASVQALIPLLNTLSGWPVATFAIAHPPVWVWGVVVFSLMLLLRWPWRWRLLGLPLLLPLLLWRAVSPAPGQFDVLVTDVGQGTAVLVRTARHRLLYDAGPRYGPDADAGHRVLVPLLRHLDEPLDVLVLSHRDSDHTGGALSVLAMQPSARLLGSLEDGHEALRARAQQRCETGQRWAWDGVTFTVLHPSGADYALAASGQLKANGLSCVLRVDNGRHTLLLTGDIEAPQERALLSAAPAGMLRAHVLLVPHHGSHTSSTGAWIDAVGPQFAFIQSGYRNRYGHPAAPVVDRYVERGIAVHGTVECGAIQWGSAQPDAVACERERRKRYWHHGLARHARSALQPPLDAGLPTLVP